MKELLDYLVSNEHYNVSENVEIAKGKYELVSDLKNGFKKVKRIWRLRK